jgi:hypothetical protein
MPLKLPRVLPFWSLFVGMAALAAIIILGLATCVYLIRTDKWKGERRIRDLELQQINLEIERKKAEIDRQLIEEKTKLLLVRHKQDVLLKQTRSARLTLEQLVSLRGYLRYGIACLKTNDLGRGVAMRANLIFQARRLFNDETEIESILPPSTFDSHRSQLLKIEEHIVDQLGTAYDPEETLINSVQEESIWLGTQFNNAMLLDARLKALTHDAPPAPPDDYKLRPPKLEVAMAEQTSLEETNSYIILPKTLDEYNRELAKHKAQ